METGTTVPSGQRTWSKITIEVDLAHDGDPELVGDHLVAELEAVIRRVGLTIMDGPQVSFEVRQPGDEISAQLPAWR